jgi:hypothetical protein
MTVGRHLDRPQVKYKLLGHPGGEAVRPQLPVPRRNEVAQVLDSRAIAPDRRQRRTLHLFVMIQPFRDQANYFHWPERETRWCPVRELGVDSGGK